MKSYAHIFLAVTLTVLFVAGCSPKGNVTSGEQASVVYTCPMHPEVIRENPGTCPKCGMDLVKSNTKGTHNHKGCNMNSGGNHNHSGGGCGMMR
jgi:hypothetical protein